MIVERDALPDSAVARRGVPQRRQLYVLLARGREAPEELLPGPDWRAPAGGRAVGRLAPIRQTSRTARLRTPDRANTATVVAGWIPPQPTGWMWDLSVPGNDDHDFYIDTVTSVLVHNCEDPEAENPAENADRSALKKVSDSRLKQLVGDPHAFKSDYVGKNNVSRFNVYIDKSTGYPFLIPNGGGNPIPTYVKGPR